MKNIKTFEMFSDIFKKWGNKAIKKIKNLNIEKLNVFLGDAFYHVDIQFKIVETDLGIDIILDRNNSHKKIENKIKQKEEIYNSDKSSVQKMNAHNVVIKPEFNHLYLTGYENIEMTEELLDQILFTIDYINGDFPLKFKKFLASFTITAMSAKENPKIAAGIWTDISLKICNYFNCIENWGKFNIENPLQTCRANVINSYPDYMYYRYNGNFITMILSFERTL